MNLNGKIAVVTGAASGIGQAISVLLAERGVKVIVVDICNADDTMKMIKAVNGVAAYFQGDVSKGKTHEDMFAFCKDTYGVPDFLIANAGVSAMISLEDSTEEDFDRIYSVNAKGTFLILKQAQKEMKAGGKIIVTGSTSVTHPVPGMVIYGGTKGAIRAMVDVAAIELGKKGITVNSICPGVTCTKEALANIPQAHLDNVKNCTPLGRIGSPLDIAKTVAMLCSEDSGWINGQHIEANGGASL